MSELLLGRGTGRTGLEETLFSWHHWLAERPTGGGLLEAGLGIVALAARQHPAVAPSPAREVDAPPGDLAARAAVLATRAPHVPAPLPPAPALSGNLAEDVRAVCGLTWAQIGAAFKISERAAAGWRVQGMPGHRRATMEALRAVGATLVGGLGPDGVAAWLTSGSPTRLERLRAGEVDPVVEEALSYRDTPAT